MEMNDKKCAWFSLNLASQTGSLERLLSRIRRRGFKVENMMVTNNALADGYRIEVRVGGQRSFETLARHLANLVDVSMVSLHMTSQPVEYATPVPA